MRDQGRQHRRLLGCEHHCRRLATAARRMTSRRPVHRHLSRPMAFMRDQWPTAPPSAGATTPMAGRMRPQAGSPPSQPATPIRAGSGPTAPPSAGVRTTACWISPRLSASRSGELTSDTPSGARPGGCPVPGRGAYRADGRRVGSGPRALPNPGRTNGRMRLVKRPHHYFFRACTIRCRDHSRRLHAVLWTGMTSRHAEALPRDRSADIGLNEQAVPRRDLPIIGAGLRDDTTAVCWSAVRGYRFGLSVDHEQADTPAGAFKAIAADLEHSCGIRADNTAVCWNWTTNLPVRSLLGGLSPEPLAAKRPRKRVRALGAHADW